MDCNSRFRSLCPARRAGCLAVFLPLEPHVVGLVELKNRPPLIGRGMPQQHTEIPEDIAADDWKPATDDAERGR